MSIIGAGITRVVCGKRYHADAESREMFNQCGIELIVIKDVEEEYDNK
jgi:deoxycytidylate deaminase